VVEGSEASAEGVVKTAKGAAALEREDVGGLFHDAELASLSVGVAADLAEWSGGEKSALLAGLDFGSGAGDGLRELCRPGILVAEEPEGATLRTSRAEAR
jgi:hypothetical protein